MNIQDYAEVGRFLEAQQPPADFRVTAIMTCFNEADLIEDSIRELRAQGVEVYLIDNWSSDDSYEIAQRCDVIGVERFPASGPSNTYDWAVLLDHVEDVARRIGGDWSLHHDADEVRESPWPRLTMRQALYGIGRLGYNAIDHTMLNFHPVDDTWAPGKSTRAHFRYFQFGTRPGHYQRINGWSHRGPVRLSHAGGHEVLFEGRRVFPYKFLLRHYAIRSQAHGERKIFVERKARYNPEEKRRGWHIHYDDLAPGHNFIKRPEELVEFDERFYEMFHWKRLFGRYQQ